MLYNAGSIVALLFAMTAYRAVIAYFFQQVDVGAGESIIQWIVQQVGMGGIAAFSLWMLNRVWKERIEAEKQHAREIDTLRAETLQALKQNVEAITRFTNKIR